MINLGIAGVGGRMGREIVAATGDSKDVVVVGGFDRSGGVVRFDSTGRIDLHALLGSLDVLVDFSAPAAVETNLQASMAMSLPYVCGVTGLTREQSDALKKAAATIPVFYARNMSVGIATILSLLPELARRLDDYDAEIVEFHHRRKVDAPSGTAIALAEAVASGRGQDLGAAAVYGRSGDAPRSPGEIGMHSLRGGANAGEHTVLFAGAGDEIRIEHRALSRRTFADGAVRAARFTALQPPGLYGMEQLVTVQ